MQPCQEDSRSFFEKLQKAEGLDLRDNLGKRHDYRGCFNWRYNGCFIESGRLFVEHSSAFGESL